ncbi:hypothetical protein MBLNU459_g0812t1 [Dothideomycetes sp. NU459]
MTFYSSRWSSFENQFWIGIFQLFPVLIPTSRLVLSTVLDGINSPKWDPSSRRGTNHLKALYLFATLVSTFTHLYTIGKVLAYDELSIWEFYVPSPQVSGFDSKVLVFLQFDYVIVMLATILWTWLDSPEEWPSKTSGLALSVGLVLGPGAVIGLARAIREERRHPQGSSMKI